MKKQFKDYYIGLDAGTNTLGWAVTDINYNILKFNGKAMWGTRLFDEGKTAAERRGFRSATRRVARKRARAELLEEIFAEEISSVDPGFYQRLKESKFREDDKTINGRYCLFNDKDFTDKDYHKAYPTIYHLRKALIEKDEKFDVRLLFLALHHIMKNRGHFLFDNTGSGEIPEFGELFGDFCDVSENEFGITLPASSKDEIAEILKAQNTGIRQRKRSSLKL